MTWLAWLGLPVLITAIAAITGVKPKGTRHVAHTGLMGMALHIEAREGASLLRPPGITERTETFKISARSLLRPWLALAAG
jgi:hypothetical protein